MDNITKRLHENRQIQLAKEILENAGYKVSKKLREEDSSYRDPAHELINQYIEEGIASKFIDTADSWGNPDEVIEETKLIASMLDTSPEDVYFVISDEKYSVPMAVDDDKFDEAFDIIRGKDSDPIKVINTKRGDGDEVLLSLYDGGKGYKLVEEYSESDEYTTFMFAGKLAR